MKRAELCILCMTVQKQRTRDGVERKRDGWCSLLVVGRTRKLNRLRELRLSGVRIVLRVKLNPIGHVGVEPTRVSEVFFYEAHPATTLSKL